MEIRRKEYSTAGSREAMGNGMEIGENGEKMGNGFVSRDSSLGRGGIYLETKEM